MAQNGDEAVCGGAGKGCYGKYCELTDTKNRLFRRFFDIDVMLVCFGNFIFYRCS